MNPLVLLGGAAAALLLLARGGKSGGIKEGNKVGETPDQERALISQDHVGWHFYRVEFRPMMVQRLKTLTINESNADPRLSVLGEAQGLVPAGSSAYQAAKALHAMGFNLWVSPTLMSPTPQARWLWAAAKEEPNPPDAWKGKLALIVSAYDDPFPGDLVTNVPPPPPEAAPPPPPEAL